MAQFSVLLEKKTTYTVVVIATSAGCTIEAPDIAAAHELARQLAVYEAGDQESLCDWTTDEEANSIVDCNVEVKECKPAVGSWVHPAGTITTADVEEAKHYG